MLNKKMYLRLVQLYGSRVSPRIPSSFRVVCEDARVLKGRFYLTKGELQACREVFELFKGLY